MDIFTTQLTRVVPLPIKPANLKVKALLKEAGASKLKEDPDHLDNHDYYFGDTVLDKNNSKDSDQEGENERAQSSAAEQAESRHGIPYIEVEKSNENKDSGVTVSEDGVRHLDLYI